MKTSGSNEGIEKNRKISKDATALQLLDQPYKFVQNFIKMVLNRSDITKKVEFIKLRAMKRVMLKKTITRFIPGCYQWHPEVIIE